MNHSPQGKRGALAAAVVLLIVLLLLPARWLGWEQGLSARADLLVAPVTAPLTQGMRWLSPPAPVENEAVRAIEMERDRWKGLYLNALADSEDLRKKLEQFGRGAMYAELPVSQILRRVIGTTAEPGGQLKVRAGTSDGVEVNSVATAEGVQLVGRVALVEPRISYVKLITDKSAGPIDGVIMYGEEQRGPKALSLQPVGSGLLQTRVRVEKDKDQKVPEIGQVVRLDDKRWPRNAQMALVIGLIERAPEQDSTGWYIVTVKPTLELERLSEVVLRISPDEKEDRGVSPKSGGSTDGGKP